jgi:hypothetical protein
MTDPIEDTQVWSSEDVDAVKRDVEEEDETGAPEKDDGHPLESADALSEPRDESGEDDTGAQAATPDLEDQHPDTS